MNDRELLNDIFAIAFMRLTYQSIELSVFVNTIINTENLSLNFRMVVKIRQGIGVTSLDFNQIDSMRKAKD